MIQYQHGTDRQMDRRIELVKQYRALMHSMLTRDKKALSCRFLNAVRNANHKSVKTSQLCTELLAVTFKRRRA